MKEHLLDLEGLTTVPEGYLRVDTEVGFLKVATKQHPLLVSDQRLCSWAETFFRGRGLPFRYVRPVVDELRDVCPGLTADQAHKVIEQIGPKRVDALALPLSLESILEELYPLDFWQRPPSTQHVADWLVWLYETDPDQHILPLLEQIGRQWHERLNQRESAFYNLITKDEGATAIEQWVTGDTGDPFSAVFPADVPTEILNRIAVVWQSEIVQTRGQYFSTIVGKDTPHILKERAAGYTANYLKSNPSIVTQERIQELARFLRRDTLNKLRDILPPDQPIPPPTNPEEVIAWFRESYFPYREWQSSQENAASRQIVMDAARHFALWYLEAYPSGLLDSGLAPLLAMKKMVAASKKSDAVRLVVVLDGLHYGDARDLMQKVGNAVPRLTVTSDDLAFASLPTITQFCKPSLLNGTPPHLVEKTTPVGRIVGDRQDPARLLSNAKRGELFLWRVAEPDKTYHSRNSSDMLHQEVQGALDTVAQNIRKIVETVPDEVLLEIIVTTDHGRLLSKADRNVTVPPDMESHGRAAWGSSVIAYDEDSYMIDGDVAYLDGFSYGLHDNAAIILDESAFKTNDDRGGSELYPHGGLFPEEVIIPWLAYARDVKQPTLEVSISGTGTARQQGTLDISIVNMDLRSVVIQNVKLQSPRGTETVETSFEMAPQSHQAFGLSFKPWFSAEEADSVTATVSVRLSNGLDFEVDADITVQSEDMYRRDNILEDLI